MYLMILSVIFWFGTQETNNPDKNQHLQFLYSALGDHLLISLEYFGLSLFTSLQSIITLLFLCLPIVKKLS